MQAGRQADPTVETGRRFEIKPNWSAKIEGGPSRGEWTTGDEMLLKRLTWVLANCCFKLNCSIKTKYV